jgi:serine/threonine protein kinase
MANELTRYCAGCMTKAPDWPKCANAECTWDELARPRDRNLLRRHTVLLRKYYIGRMLGKGGFGITYLARDLSTASRVAIKEFFPKDQCFRHDDWERVCSDDTDLKEFDYGRDRFLDEVHALANLDHPNIVPVKGCEQANGTAYMVMAYIEGETLMERITRNGGRLSLQETREIAAQVMEALDEVHRNKLVHRDISPDNILISRRGVVKLIDFGAARYAIGAHSMDLTTILKHGYAPPEQYRMRGHQGPWTDVYALAATFYHCITGKIPPRATDREDKDELVPPSVAYPELPKEIEDALLMALEVKVENRFETIEAFRHALNGGAQTEAQKQLRLEKERQKRLKDEQFRKEGEREKQAEGEQLRKLEEERLEKTQDERKKQLEREHRERIEAIKRQQMIPPSFPWAAVFLLTVLTGGLFGLVWAFVQAVWIQKIYERSRATLLFSLASICYLVSAFAYVVSLFATEDGTQQSDGISPDQLMLFSLFVGLLGLVVFLIGAFDMRRSLLACYMNDLPGFRLDWVLTVLGSIFYIQYHLTRIAEHKRLLMLSRLG